jgi:DDE superfamily endonuclease
VVLISDGHGGDEAPRLRDPALGLSAFRSWLYGCFGRRADALVELTDAILTTNTNPSLVHLSLASVHRRGWGSLYAALNEGRIGAGVLRNLLARLRLADDGGRARVYAVDQSSWPRCDAECSPDGGYYYHPSRHSAGQPIVAGWSYQLVAELGFERDSWVTPADIRRVRPEEDADLVAIEQVRGLLHRLPEQSFSPLFVFDAGYDPVRLQLGLENHPAQILVRLHSDRVFYFDPEDPEKKPVGRPFRHGKRFDLKDPETWPQPATEHHSQTGDYGTVRVRAWSGLHPKTRRAAERYGSESAAVVKGTVMLVEVERFA